MAKEQMMAKDATKKPIAKRYATPVHLGPVAQLMEPDPVVLQRAVTDPAKTKQAEILVLQRSYGNRAVQRLVKEGDEVKAGGQVVAMDTGTKAQNANCHGYTYGTWAKGWGNPTQSEGVKTIVEQEAGGSRMSPAGPWDVGRHLVGNGSKGPGGQVDKGNLVVFHVPSVPFAHSAEVTSGGSTWDRIKLANKQGQGGSVVEEPIKQTSQAGNEKNKFEIFNTTPKAE